MRKMLTALMLMLVLCCAVALAEDVPFPTDVESFPYSSEDFAWTWLLPDVTIDVVDDELTVAVDWQNLDFYYAYCRLLTPNSESYHELVFGDTNSAYAFNNNRMNLNQSFRLAEPPDDFDADAPGNVVEVSLSAADYSTSMTVSYSVLTGEILEKTIESNFGTSSSRVNYRVDFDSSDHATYYYYANTALISDDDRPELAFWFLNYDENGKPYTSTYSRLLYPDGVSVEYDDNGQIAPEPIYLFDGSKVYQWSETDGAWLDGGKAVEGLTPYAAENYPRPFIPEKDERSAYERAADAFVYASLFGLDIDAAQLLAEIPVFSTTGIDSSEEEAYYDYETAIGLPAEALYRSGVIIEVIINAMDNDAYPFDTLTIGMSGPWFLMRLNNDNVQIYYDGDGMLDYYFYVDDELELPILYDAQNQFLDDFDGIIDPADYPPLSIIE